MYVYLFDFNGDGYTDASEELMAFQILDDMERDNSYDTDLFDDDEFDDDMFDDEF